MTRAGSDPTDHAVGAQLTPREQAVLAELADDDVTVEEIAARLWVSRNTVKSQLRSVYRKLGVSTRADAVAWARAAGVRRPHARPAQRSPSQPSG